MQGRAGDLSTDRNRRDSRGRVSSHSPRGRPTSARGRCRPLCSTGGAGRRRRRRGRNTPSPSIELFYETFIFRGIGVLHPEEHFLVFTERNEREGGGEKRRTAAESFSLSSSITFSPLEARARPLLFLTQPSLSSRKVCTSTSFRCVLCKNMKAKARASSFLR